MAFVEEALKDNSKWEAALKWFNEFPCDLDVTIGIHADLDLKIISNPSEGGMKFLKAANNHRSLKGRKTWEVLIEQALKDSSKWDAVHDWFKMCPCDVDKVVPSRLWEEIVEQCTDGGMNFLKEVQESRSCPHATFRILVEVASQDASKVDALIAWLKEFPCDIDSVPKYNMSPNLEKIGQCLDARYVFGRASKYSVLMENLELRRLVYEKRSLRNNTLRNFIRASRSVNASERPSLLKRMRDWYKEFPCDIDKELVNDPNYRSDPNGRSNETLGDFVDRHVWFEHLSEMSDIFGRSRSFGGRLAAQNGSGSKPFLSGKAMVIVALGAIGAYLAYNHWSSTSDKSEDERNDDTAHPRAA